MQSFEIKTKRLTQFKLYEMENFFLGSCLCFLILGLIEFRAKDTHVMTHFLVDNLSIVLSIS